MLKRCFPLMRRGSAASRRTVRHVSEPERVRLICRKVPLHQIRCVMLCSPWPCGAAEAPLLHTLQTCSAHQTRDAFAPHADPVGLTQLHVNARRTVGAVVGALVDLLDQRSELNISAPSRRQRPIVPVIEPRQRHLKQPAHETHRVEVLVRPHDSECRFEFGAVSWAVGSSAGARWWVAACVLCYSFFSLRVPLYRHSATCPLPAAS